MDSQLLLESGYGNDHGRIEGGHYLLRGRINRDRILRNWDDLLRVAGSRKRGWVTASLLMRHGGDRCFLLRWYRRPMTAGNGTIDGY